MKKNNLTLVIAINALFMALIAILTFVPYVGFIPLGFTSITIIHLVVIIGAFLLGKRSGAALGLFMGICSLLHSGIGTAQDTTFVWPWVSILPRVIFGYLAGLYFEKIKIKKTPLKCFLLSGLATLTHTLLVFVVYLPTFVFMFGDGEFFAIFDGTIGGNSVSLPLTIFCLASFLFSCFFESLVAMIVIPPLYLALNSTRTIKKLRKYNI